ncbi:MAG TPA: PAS domain-containing protein, partial [Rhizobacter sp.]|nr:PAS domain-containing protein [Rhizobacter sp.]
MDQLWLSAPAIAMRLWPAGVSNHNWRLNPAAAAWAHRGQIERGHWDALADQLRDVLGAASPGLDGRTAVGPLALQVNWTAVPFSVGWVVWLADDPARSLLAEATPARWLRALKLASVTAWRLNLVTGRAHFSDRDYHALHANAPPAEDLSVDEVRDQVHPDDRAAVLRAAEEAMASNQVVDVEARYRGKKGDYRTLLIRRVAERDESGRVIALSGVSLDLSDRIAERESAQAYARRTDEVTNAAGVGIWSLDMESGLIEWNEPMYRMHGVPREDGPPDRERWFDLVYPDDREMARRNTSLVIEGTAGLQADFRILRPDGSVRWVSSWSRREALAGRSMMFGVIVDVTDLQEAQAELRKTQERARLAAESAGVGMWERDLFDNTSSWDAQMFRLRGYAPDCGHLPEQLRQMTCHPEDMTLFDLKLELAARDGTAFEHEFRVVWPDGSLHWIATRGLVKRDPNTGHKRMLGVNWDVTEHKRAERALREKVAAEHACQAKSEFLARMSHELRTPLNAVLGFAQLLRDDYTESLSQQQHQRVNRIHSAGLHLLALVDDVLDLATIRSDSMPLEQEPVSLQGVLDDVLVWTQAQAAQSEVTIHAQAMSGWVRADSRRVRQILSNLLSNAIKYNRTPGQIWIGEAATEIDGQRAWRLSVRDTGKGLSPAQYRDLYQPFNRLGAERGSIQGTGIGLAIVNHLVRRMGGTITVRSELDVGSEFEVTLPAAEPVEPPNVPSISGFQPDLNGIV